MTEFAHTTVMLRETVEAVLPQPGRVYVDATLGGGGHSEALLEAGGKVYALDRDPQALAAAGKRLARFGDRAVLLHAPFSELRARLAEHGVARVDGLVADLGVSSPQLDDAARGFSFARAGDLDMRMDPTSGLTLRELLATLPEKELADAIYELGDERRSRPIARSIKAAEVRGELGTTEDLRRAIVRVTGPRRGGIDPATRTFQALRMLVNGELTELKVLLEALGELLEDRARVAIISFHSGEDRLVKHAFRDDPRLEVVTKRPLEASEQERTENPRARSAKLRVAQRAERGVDLS